MADGMHRTDILPGVLQGEDFQGKCKVTLATNLTPGRSGYGGTTSLRITTTEDSLPDGIYYLNVYGRIFKIERVNGKWPPIRLSTSH